MLFRIIMRAKVVVVAQENRDNEENLTAVYKVN